MYITKVPTKFTFRFLQSLGFKSSKMRDLVPFLQAFDFLDVFGLPTNTYVEFKNSMDPQLFVSTCAKRTYEAVLPKIEALNEPSVKEVFFITYSDLSPEKLNLVVKTFLAINEYAPFCMRLPLKEAPTPSIHKNALKQNLNININLPETDNDRVYEAIFKHLKELLH